MSSVVEASAREIYDAYYQALVRQDWPSVRFWRPVLIERLGQLNGRATNHERPTEPYRANPEG